MPDAPVPRSPGLSHRAEEILRRATAQVEAARSAPPAAPDSPPLLGLRPAAPVFAPPREPAGESSAPDEVDRLIGIVVRGLGVARAHLIELSASVERVREELQGTVPHEPVPAEPVDPRAAVLPPSAPPR